MSTRIVSWQQLVQEADPDWLRLHLNPVQYTFSNGRIFTRPVPVYGLLPSSGLASDGGVIILLDPTGWPSSVNQLAPGAVYYDDGMVVVVTPNAPPPPPNPAPLFFPGITSDQLLHAGAATLPLTDPHVVGQLWNNGLVVCASLG